MWKIQKSHFLPQSTLIVEGCKIQKKTFQMAANYKLRVFENTATGNVEILQMSDEGEIRK